MAVTIVATVLMPDLEQAILIGIAVAVIIHLWNTGEIRDEILKDNPAGITLVHIEGDLYFGSANDLE
jgi:MFS superfamily sulfate permease-like transporter